VGLAWLPVVCENTNFCFSSDHFFSEKQPNVLMELSFLIFTFLKKAHNENTVQVKVTGSRRLENGLVVPRSFLARMTSRAITTKFEEEIIHLKNLCTHMDIRLLFL